MHVFCWSCLEKWVEKNEGCPLCASKHEGIKKCHFIDNLINVVVKLYDYCKILQEQNKLLKDVDDKYSKVWQDYEFSTKSFEEKLFLF